MAALEAAFRTVGRGLETRRHGTAILTAEHGGIAPAVLLGREVSSFTHRRLQRLHISQECCAGIIRVHVVDDFLSIGSTACALGGLAGDLGIDVLGFAFVVNTACLGGEALLRDTFTAPLRAVVSLDAPRTESG